MTHIVLVCQNRACLKLGAASVLAAFQAAASPAIVVVKSPCLGQCGNGPMVRILPEDIWYWRVNATEVPAVIQRHLLGGQPIQAMLYPHFHSP
ncbi:(2Fe-2S) ferredoxin domain-containing protein [Pantanalinema sp. GBBB05]|uniref:(2Fe-2S) ferredoxin domain-containing protein n=1 Tax=Pantanalinema sp. GBBB05 TaxID=2604139 RepID=UPI001DF6BA64|nr:(2Fe-2S) ferredoxin domain-containing protein [Pantanalinema sp. GBBB05]